MYNDSGILNISSVDAHEVSLNNASGVHISKPDSSITGTINEPFLLNLTRSTQTMGVELNEL